MDIDEEKALAQEMWIEIAYKIEECCHFDVKGFKEEFCRRHGLSWLSDCWLCEHIECCDDCPLSMNIRKTSISCSEGYTWYGIVCSSYEETELRVECAYHIAEVLGAVVPIKYRLKGKTQKEWMVEHGYYRQQD